MTSFAPRDWIEIFKNEIYKSVLLELPESFIDYLNSESIFDGDNDILSQLSETEDEALDSLDNTYDVQNPKILFPEIYESINNILNLFQTGCIPKLCSSSPKDSIWLTPDNSLRCRTASQIFHLLKASDRVSLEASKLLHNKDLLLVKWDLKFDPGQEFRAFVKDNHLLAICQRNDTVYYPHLEEIALKIIESISKYLLDRVYKKAPWSDCLISQTRIFNDIRKHYSTFHEILFETGIKNILTCEIVVIDLYFTDPSLKNIKIIDFAPLDEKETCSILFDWSELKDIKKENSPKLKLIRSEDDCRLGFMRLNAIPIDWEQFMKPDTIPKF